MTNPAWGKKRVCPGCAVRYYDLKKATPVCPKCGTPIDVHVLDRGKRRALGGINSSDVEALDKLSFNEEEDANLSEEVLDEDRFGDDLSNIGEKDLRDDL